MINYREFLQKRYDKFWNISKESILNNEIEIDTHLLNIEKDERLGLILLIPITGECSDNFVRIINQLKEIEPEQYYYPKTDIHVTVMEFIACSEDFVFDKKQVETYKKVLDKVLQNFSKFYIEFKGLTARKGAVLVQGFFNDPLQKLREKLRKELNKQDVKLRERYRPSAAHCTIVRFKQKLIGPEAFVRKIQELRDFDFGTFEVKKILFVLHDWYNIKEKTKILSEYELS